MCKEHGPEPLDWFRVKFLNLQTPTVTRLVSSRSMFANLMQLHYCKLQTGIVPERNPAEERKNIPWDCTEYRCTPSSADTFQIRCWRKQARKEAAGIIIGRWRSSHVICHVSYIICFLNGNRHDTITEYLQMLERKQKKNKKYVFYFESSWLANLMSLVMTNRSLLAQQASFAFLCNEMTIHCVPARYYENLEVGSSGISDLAFVSFMQRGRKGKRSDLRSLRCRRIAEKESTCVTSALSNTCLPVRTLDQVQNRWLRLKNLSFHAYRK